MESVKKLNLWDIFCIATGTMISSGLFVLPAIAYKYGGPSILLAYFIAGFLMIPSIFSKSELLSAMPKAGGTYFFIERSFGPFLGIFGGLAGWFSLSLKSAFALIGIGMFLEYFLPSVNNPQFYLLIKLIAASFCIIFALVNIFSVKLTAHIQNIMVTFLLFICFTYILLGMKEISWQNFQPFFPEGPGSLLPVIGMVFISYGGLTKVTAIAEDTKNPFRTIPVGMFLSFFVVQIIYCLCIAVTIGILSPLAITSTFTPLTQGALKLGGIGFAIILSIAALTAFISTANAGILSSSRIPLAMAKDDLLPSKFSLVSKKSQTPYFSIIFTGLFMLVLILFLDLESLVKIASTLMILLFIFVNFSVIIMRESKVINYRPTFKSPFYPWVQIVGIIVYGILIFGMGKIPLIVSAFFIGISFAWFALSVRKIKRHSALMHLVERITAKEFVDTSLEDELKEILHKRDRITKDRFDHLVEGAIVLDLEEGMDRDSFFQLISEKLSLRLDIDSSQIKSLLIKREDESHTILEKGLAIPHIVVPGESKFEIVLVRARKGIVFSSEEEPVHIIFVLVGSIDERNFHLRSLMAIAQIVREGDFYANWMRMKDQESLKMLVLSSTRKRE
ncbi:MAG: amino acid permease [Candidatus Omnitrophica bacterium]|nr:amino acid permease [Candidatus Omnitrophota bacterium]